MPSMVPSMVPVYDASNALKEYKNSLMFHEKFGMQRKKEERFERMNCLVVQQLPSHGAGIGNSSDCK